MKRVVDLPSTLNVLINYDPSSLKVNSREGKHREFKEKFENEAFSLYTRTLAAFSNTAGGTLIFGVTDSPRKVVGVNPDDIPEEAKWSDRLRKDFDPEVPIDICECPIKGVTVVSISVDKHLQRPVICKRDTNRWDGQKNKPVLRAGTVYHRYTAQVRPIGYSEMQALLIERDDRRSKAILENLAIMEKVGPDKVLIVDASSSDLPQEASNIYVSREVATTLNFIDRGRFVENDEPGSPAYFVAGTVKLNEAIEKTIVDADRIFPEEAVERLKSVVEAMFGEGTPFGVSHLAKFAKFLGFRDGNETDNEHCVYDDKVNRVYYLPPAIQHMDQKLRTTPTECLSSFASKATIKSYQDKQKNEH